VYLIFTMQGDLYAFDLAQIARVTDPPHCCWPIPSVPDCYKGAVNMHGSIIAVIDLALFMGWPRDREPGKMVVLSPMISSLAFLVESVLRVIPKNEVSVHAPSLTRFAASSLVLGDGKAVLLDVDSMVTVAEQMVAR
jgi:chemotaxis signal transduction protein